MKTSFEGQTFVITGGNVHETPSGLYIRHNFPVGEVVTLVGGINDDDYGYYEDAKGYEQGVSDRFVRPFKEETGVIKANVGDKFEVIDARGKFNVGDIVTLIRYDGDGINKYENADGYGQHMKDCRLKKVGDLTVKKGDKFVIIGGISYHGFSNGEGVTLVETDFADGIHLYEGKNGKRKWVKPNMLTPHVVTAPKVEGPQVGDKFKVIDGGGEYPIGTIVTLERICQDGCHRYSSETRGSWYVNTSRLVPIETLKFNVGDTVTALANVRPYHFEKAVPGVITSTDSGSKGHRGQYMVEIPSANGGTYEIGFKEEEIEVRVEETPVAKKSAKEGDYIVIDVEASRKDASYYAHDITEGTEYLVHSDSYGDLYFLDDAVDERNVHIKKGYYTVVEAAPVDAEIKLGDFVVGTKGTRYFITNENMLLAKVVRVGDDGYIRVEVVKAVPGTNTEDYVGNSYTIIASEVRKATEAEIAEVQKPKFKAGNYIVALPSADKEYAITTTDMPLAVVLHTDEDHFFCDSDDDIKIEYLGDRDLRDSTYEVNSKFFRKATEEEIAAVVVSPESVTYEVGDIVRITSDTSSVNEKGDIGEVVHADSDETFRVSVNARKGASNWHIAESVELIAKARK